jgi:chromosome segregation ATPase
LEDSYQQLLKHVQQLQNTHLHDLRNSEQRFHSASSALQKALVSKSEELITLSNKLTSSESRYERDSREWAKERVSLLSQVEMLSQKDAEWNNKLQDRERRLVELNSLRKEMAERIAVREQELIKYGKALRDKEQDYESEKENRMRLELKIMKVEQDLEKRDGEVKDLQISLQRKQLEAEDLANTKLQLSEARRDIEDLSRREKHYLGEMDQMAVRERKLYKQVEDMSAQERRNMQEVAKISEKHSALVAQLDDAHKHESELQQQVDALQKQSAQQQEEIKNYERTIRQYQQDSSRMLQEFNGVQQIVSDLRNTNQTLAKELALSRELEANANKERESLQARLLQTTREYQTKQRDLDLATQEIQDLTRRIETEQQQQQDFRQQNKEKFSNVTSKITELQETLTETQQQLIELRNNEKNLRNLLKQREDALKVQTQQCQEAEARVQELLTGQNKEQLEFETYKTKKRDEILAIQDKYAHAKQAMDAEVNQLRFQFGQRQAQLNAAVEEINQLKQDLSDENALKLALETRIAELVANDNSMQRQLASLQQQLNQKQQELARLSSKNVTLADQTKRLDDELQIYRETTNQVRDSDISKLQNNMEEISKRLKNQVEILLEKDSVGESRSRTGSNSNSAIKSRYSLTPTTASSPRAPKSLLDQKDDEPDFDQIDKLLAKTTFLKSTQ